MTIPYTLIGTTTLTLNNENISFIAGGNHTIEVNLLGISAVGIIKDIGVIDPAILTITGDISTTGSHIAALRMDNVILSGDNTTGTSEMRIESSTVTVSALNNLGPDAAQIIMDGSTLATTGNITKAGNVSGPLSIDNGDLNITGVLTTSRPFTIGANSNFLGGGTLNGPISGTGDLSLGTGNWVFRGVNSYSGGTTIINTVTLTGDSNGIQGDVTFFGAGPMTVTFDQGFSGTFSGTLTGAATNILQKSGSGRLNFSSNSAGFVGATTILAGDLGVNGTLGGTVTINSGGTLSGNANVGTVINNGNVSPGNSIGVINIVGDYTQGAGANLTIELNDAGQSDVLNVTGTSTLAGSITINPEQGIYMEGDTYTFLNTAVLNGTFDQLLETAPQDFRIDYFPLIANPFAQIVITASNAILPIPIDDLSGNPASVGGYLFPLNFLPTNNPDYLTVLAALVALTPNEFIKALNNLSPAQFGALPLENLNKGILFSDPYADQIEQRMWCLRCDADKKSRPKQCPTEEHRTSIWSSLVEQWYHQDGIQEQYGFQDNTYGFNLGASHLFTNDLFLSGGAGYSHSDLVWKDYKGQSIANTLYIAPSIGYSQSNYFVNFLTQVAFNWYDVERHIEFTGINRTADNHHMSYDLLLRLDGGYKVVIRDIKGEGGPFLVVPEGRLSYLNVFEEGYSETGASSLNLKVDSKKTVFLQPELLVKILKEFYTTSACFIPMIKVGYISKIPLSSASYAAKLKNVSLPGHMTVKSFHWNSNQLMPFESPVNLWSAVSFT